MDFSKLLATLLQAIRQLLSGLEHTPNTDSNQSAKPSSPVESVSTSVRIAFSATIENEQLFPFMLGGIYFFSGYGGATYTINQLIIPATSVLPGERNFLPRLTNAYERYFIYPFEPAQATSSTRTLATWWGINNRADLMESLDELEKQGSQAEYEQCILDLAESNPVDATDDSEHGIRRTFVKTHWGEFPAGGIRAWDLARYVNNVCIAYSAGYVSKQEGHQILARLPALARAHFDNWPDYWTSYLLGLGFWGGDRNGEQKMADVAHQMQQGSHSIFIHMRFKPDVTP